MVDPLPYIFLALEQNAKILPKFSTNETQF